MAKVTDPDNLDRKEVIFGTESREISIWPVGSLVGAGASGIDGRFWPVTNAFTSTSATFSSWGAAPNDILLVFNKGQAAHHRIASVDSETGVTITGYVVDVAESGLWFEVRDPTGGAVEDGVTEQCLYSFSKIEWRTDSELYAGDDLIRYWFPFEMITPKQAEIGGGDDNWDWEFFNYYTRKKIRDGGWDSKNSTGGLVQSWAGMGSLGDMDSDAQPYYQQYSATQDPVDFEFTGKVNESVLIWEPMDNRRTYFKAFLRKKYKTYSSYDLNTEQEYVALENTFYQFPLSHVTDAAIVDTDGEIMGTSPYTARTTADSGTNGVTTASSSTFSETGQNFLTTAHVGDVLYITTGSDAGYWEVTEVVNDTTLTCDTWEHSGGLFTGDTVLTWTLYTRFIIADAETPRTDGVLADIDGDTGTLDSATAGFSGVVSADDLVIIVESGSDHRGVYKVVSVTDDDTLVLNTEDKAFTSVGSIDFYIVEPGMFLQYKWDEISLSATGNLTFNDADPTDGTIERASGDWSSDGVEVGDIIVISGTTNNNGSFTVAGVTSSKLTVVSTDTIVDEGAVSCTKNVYRGFRRTINSVVYGFKWRLLGNDATLGDCYQYCQHQLRQTTDIDHGPEISRGDITDILMAYSFPTATTYDMVIDDLNAADANNITYIDATGVSRTEKYIAAGNISFNTNLQGDANAKYWMFFTNDDAGDDAGYDYGTINAIIVQKNDTSEIKGNVGGSPSISFDYDYDGNVQRGEASAGEDAPVTIVAIGLQTATFVKTTGTIERTKTNNFSLVAPLERNYSNP